MRSTGTRNGKASLLWSGCENVVVFFGMDESNTFPNGGVCSRFLTAVLTYCTPLLIEMYDTHVYICKISQWHRITQANRSRLEKKLSETIGSRRKREKSVSMQFRVVVCFCRLLASSICDHSLFKGGDMSRKWPALNGLNIYRIYSFNHCGGF